MKKLSLNVENLKIESFETADAVEAQGTVAVHALRTFPAPVETCAYHCTWYPGTGCE